MCRRCSKRKEDIPQLVRHFVARFSAARTLSPKATGIAPDAMALLTAHDWPGNIRELENAIHRAIVLERRRRTDPRSVSADRSAIARL
jgi:DNA-binding NtrC family response regulator